MTLDEGATSYPGELPRLAKLPHPEHVRMTGTKLGLLDEPWLVLGMQLLGDPGTAISDEVVLLDPEFLFNGQIAETVQLFSMAPEARRTVCLTTCRRECRTIGARLIAMVRTSSYITCQFHPGNLTSEIVGRILDDVEVTACSAQECELLCI